MALPCTAKARVREVPGAADRGPAVRDKVVRVGKVSAARKREAAALAASLQVPAAVKAPETHRGYGGFLPARAQIPTRALRDAGPMQPRAFASDARRAGVVLDRCLSKPA